MKGPSRSVSLHSRSQKLRFLRLLYQAELPSLQRNGLRAFRVGITQELAIPCGGGRGKIVEPRSLRIAVVEFFWISNALGKGIMFGVIWTLLLLRKQLIYIWNATRRETVTVRWET